jgi:hypothetical protein
MGMERGGYGVFYGTIEALTIKYWGNNEKTVSVTGIRTEHIPNGWQTLYRSANPFRFRRKQSTLQMFHGGLEPFKHAM